MPPAPTSAVGVVVWKDDRVLLVQRGQAPHVGQWTLPGGRQKWGETVAEAAVREVREETGIEIDLVCLIDVVDLIADDHHFVVTEMAARWLSGRARAGSDAADLIWAEPSQWATLGLSEDVRRVIKAGAERLSSATR
ncbi:NUDIX hydrolase [Magnetospira sp. QH-2]|uniref:NUDIX hydrolase n=1 Tax=Magnetospira sp. (strain QH-2) TaxID=1288970 RepID=UPI0009E508A9|nr:NUDIX hydrolase [Magnetospira sp. QH-2]